eukprot:14535696-Alexandrium_andersonii.AAC.1
MRSMWPAALICQLSPRAWGVAATTQPALRRLWAGWLTTDSSDQPSFRSQSSSSPADQGGVLRTRQTPGPAASSPPSRTTPKH